MEAKRSIRKDTHALMQGLSEGWQDWVLKVVGTLSLPNKPKHFVTVVETEDHCFKTVKHRMQPKNHPTPGLKYRMNLKKRFILIPSS